MKIKISIRLTFWQSPHGDYDHMGEAINLVDNFKVEKVIFNCGEFNELEQKLTNDRIITREYELVWYNVYRVGNHGN